MTNLYSGAGRASLPFSTVLAHARSASALALRAAPAKACALMALSVVGGVVPVATAWLMKLILDRIASPAAATGMSVFVALGVGVAAAGATGVLMTHVTQFLDAELSRAVALGSQQALYEAVNKLNGLARLEQPRFHDQLQLALHAGRDGPSQLVHGIRGPHKA